MKVEVVVLGSPSQNKPDGFCGREATDEDGIPWLTHTYTHKNTTCRQAHYMQTGNTEEDGKSWLSLSPSLSHTHTHTKKTCRHDKWTLLYTKHTHTPRQTRGTGIAAQCQAGTPRPGTNVGSELEPVVGSESLAGLSGSESRTSVLLSPHGQSSRKINCKAKTCTPGLRT